MPTKIVLGLLLCTLWAPAIRAQTEEERAIARELMDQGDLRVEQRDYAAALALFRAAHDIMHVPTTGIEVARTLVSLGKLVEGRDAALDVLKLPQAADEPKPFTIARVAADQLVRDLTYEIPTLRVVLGPPDAVPHASLRIDGMSCPQALKVPYPLNPNPHRVEVSAPGFEPLELSVALARRGRESLRVELKPLPKRAAPSPISSGAPTRARAPLPPRTKEYTPARSPSWVTWGGLGMVGAGLTVGTVAGLVALDRVDDAREYCDGDRCQPEARPDREAAIRAGHVSNLGWAMAGAGALVTLASWLFQTPKSPPAQASQSSLVLVPGPKSGLVTWKGTL
ncbi:MAG: hypothetical protein M3020_09390 [Myxococcota bacterium]|nr:hypothetical protein [Myxococcota bacterium]